ncbi:MAG: hypothetical protein A4S09_06405 [Proteobacteria bacterium SG_bin7]|nr:MAG: hypothetical protein A4S09_06405 [Proteobacteria bacterium SG_bin7]
MRKVVVTILVLIGFLNSVAFADGDLLSSVSTGKQTIESATSTSHASDTSSHESNTHSHQCHVGHCAFVVTETSSFNSNQVDDSRRPIQVSVYLGSFQSELFRPPIL